MQAEFDGAAVVDSTGKPGKAPRKQQQRSLLTQQKLIDAAIEAFAENGFKGTSTRDIAERAGVHHPLITYHFKNKDLLWRAAVERIFSEFYDSLERVLQESEPLDARTRLENLIRAYVRQASRQPALHRILTQESNHPNPRLDWLIESWLRPMFRRVHADIRELQDRGIVPDGNPALVFNMIRMAAGGLVSRSLEVQRTSDVELQAAATLEEITELIINVFLPDENR